MEEISLSDLAKITKKQYSKIYWWFELGLVPFIRWNKVNQVIILDKNEAMEAIKKIESAQNLKEKLNLENLKRITNPFEYSQCLTTRGIVVNRKPRQMSVEEVNRQVRAIFGE